MTAEEFRKDILTGIPDTLPPPVERDLSVSHAPRRRDILTREEKKLALKNALRYFPERFHEELAPEFARELAAYGRIYMYRFRPKYRIYARPVGEYPHRSVQAAAIMLMISNNLDEAVAQHPHELITYGGNGAVFQNWAQYRLTMKYLAEMTDEQTLVMYSGHPLGLFPSHREAPRVVVTNGMVIPNYSSQEDYERFNALGVTQYGQMTAGSFMYIGPQGIVHGTTITVLNAGRKALGTSDTLRGKVFISSGLGGMSGAQAKAAVIAGAVGVIAEVNPAAAKKRHDQGWLNELYDDLDKVIGRMQEAREKRIAVSIGYLGNIVDLWEALAERDIPVELGSDQTSLHNPYGGGYYPAGLTLEEANRMMADEPERFKEKVHASLRRHVKAVNTLAARGMYFWDYGNAFLLEAGRAGADIFRPDGTFRYASYVEDIMGPLFFDYGFGPFRWVCTSSDPEDLKKTDEMAAAVMEEIAAEAPEQIRHQMQDNIHWIREAWDNRLVVGSQARILYADCEGRVKIAKHFNEAVRKGILKAPVVLGRDHHDVGGTDSPYRETADIKDGSMFTADMSVHNFVGGSFRGATWVSLHNGGGVGWGEAINGGFGMVLDGSGDCEKRIHSVLSWDVNNGIARRAWANNPGSISSIRLAMDRIDGLSVTLPNDVDERILGQYFG